MISELSVPVMDQAGGDVTLLRWLKREGEAVQVGEALCEVETSKANVEITAETSGVLRRILIAEGTAIPARTVMALLGAANDPLPEIDPYYRVAGTASQSALAATAKPDMLVGERGRQRAGITASPRAKKLAADHGIDLAKVSGSGPGGRIVEEDVQRLIAGV
jgi:pyruvate/2-oxoglutarate dehydrogenase complex dihydrolipoamide acyltransferase (E2) component